MTTKSAVIFIVIVAAVVFAVFAFFPKPLPPPPGPSQATEITPPVATGNVDDLINATFSEISDEELLIKEEEKDTSLITLDSQEVSDFGQTINGSEF